MEIGSVFQTRSDACWIGHRLLCCNVTGCKISDDLYWMIIGNLFGVMFPKDKDGTFMGEENRVNQRDFVFIVFTISYTMIAGSFILSLLMMTGCRTTSGSSSRSYDINSSVTIGPFAESESDQHQRKIQTIIDAASKGRPLVFRFQPGIYHISNPVGIRIPQHTTLILTDTQFVLAKEMKEDGQVFLVDQASDVTFEGGEIRGQREAWDPGVNIAGIRVRGSVKNIRVLNTQFKNLSSNAVGVFGEDENRPARHIIVKGIQVDNCCNEYVDYLQPHKGPVKGSVREDQGGIAFYNVTDWRVDGCTLTRSQSDGTHFFHSHRGVFENNIVEESRMGGYFLEGCRYVVATGNQVCNNGSRGVTIERDSLDCTLQHNLITGSGREGLWAPDVQRIVVLSNVFNENGQKDDGKKDCEIRLDETSEYKTITRQIQIEENFFFTLPHQTAAI